jgi:hypothetical protein
LIGCCRKYHRICFRNWKSSKSFSFSHQPSILPNSVSFKLSCSKLINPAHLATLPTTSTTPTATAHPNPRAPRRPFPSPAVLPLARRHQTAKQSGTSSTTPTRTTSWLAGACCTSPHRLLPLQPGDHQARLPRRRIPQCQNSWAASLRGPGADI